MTSKKIEKNSISAERFERELAALTRLYNKGVINASTHKARYDALVRMMKK